ncbi:MAG: chemotaxis protein CheW, partial [Hydrogenovibrio crunogenus]|nr:chemotaxis protein CheW [Hydrogenovibrio crunogenus]
GLTTIKDPEAADKDKEDTKEIGMSKSSKGRMVIVIDIDKLASEGLIEQVANADESIPLQNG